MRRHAFIVAVFGILILLVLLFELPAKEIFSVKDLGDLKVNQKVVLRGVVEGERVFGDFKVLKVKGVEVTCDCPANFKYLDENVEIFGIIGEYNGRKQVKVLKIIVRRLLVLAVFDR